MVIQVFKIKCILIKIKLFINLIFLLETNKRKKNLSSEDSSDSDSNCFSSYPIHSKEEQFDGASCSRTHDSDSNISDDSSSKTSQNVENDENIGNKGLSLMVII